MSKTPRRKCPVAMCRHLACTFSLLVLAACSTGESNKLIYIDQSDPDGMQVQLFVDASSERANRDERIISYRIEPWNVPPAMRRRNYTNLIEGTSAFDCNNRKQRSILSIEHFADGRTLLHRDASEQPFDVAPNSPMEIVYGYACASSVSRWLKHYPVIQAGLKPQVPLQGV